MGKTHKKQPKVKASGPKVYCPACGAGQHKVETAAMYRCEKCHGLFDDSPDEGGSYCTDPSKRLEREERNAERKQQQRQRQMLPKGRFR